MLNYGARVIKISYIIDYNAVCNNYVDEWTLLKPRAAINSRIQILLSDVERSRPSFQIGVRL